MNRKGNRFQNNDASQGFAFADFLRWRWQRLRLKRERVAAPPVGQGTGPQNIDPEIPAVTWLGHATFLIQYRGANILTDPHLSGRASPVPFAGPKRVTPPGLTVDDLPQIDAIVISHNHYDHLDAWTLRQIFRRQPRNVPQVFVPLGLGSWFRRRRFPEVCELDWWDHRAWRDWTFHAMPAQHFSGRGPLDHNRSLWAGWILRCRDFNFFFVGDSGWSNDFIEIGKRFAPVDVAAIPIAAYEPRWIMKPVHVNPDEAVRIHQAVAARLSIAMHWGTFLLTDEAADEPPRRLAAALADAGLSPEEFCVMQPGETRQLAT